MKKALTILCLCIYLSLAQTESLPKSCADSGKHGVQLISGIAPFEVFCDAGTMNGNWTVIQRCINGTVDFYRSWSEYKYGFGNATGEYWIGLENLYLMNSYEAQELLIMLEDFTYTTKYAHYDSFEIDGENQGYKLVSLGQYTGGAGNSLWYHVGANFATYDRDTATLLARNRKSGWWAIDNAFTNLNGMYLKGEFTGRYAYGIVWSGFRLTSWYSLKSVRMMIRPKQY